MYTPVGKGILLFSLLSFVVVDSMTLLSSCERTPPPSHGGGAVGLLLQLCAIAAIAFCMQYFRLTYRPPRPATDMNRLRIIVLSIIFCFVSVGFFRQSILFSDILNKPRGTISSGEACFR